MSSSAYTFLPWARQGLSNRISAADLDASVKLRAEISVELELHARQLDGVQQTVPLPPRSVQLYGPGDVIGLESRAIVRTEPRDWITDFEPNYLAAIEFYDEDLPWRYTPAAPVGARLRPWLMLVVLAEGEFTDGKNIKDRPLAFITVPSGQHATLFPSADDLWAWAHVHANRSLTQSDAEIVASDVAAVASRLDATVNENPDLAYSRIVCPRRLDANRAYHAFLVPVFESGRLAGLHLDPNLAPHATASAWGAYSGREEGDNFPIYFRWYFRTGAVGDFEHLVRLLQPRPVDKRVGVRDMDVQTPGSNLPGITDPALGGVLQLGGALRVPRLSLLPDELAEVERQETWFEPYPHVFQRGLAAFVNLADTYQAKTAQQANTESGLDIVAGDPDPMITAPLYARWHAQTARLLDDRDGSATAHRKNWVHQLNLDPRFRVPAGFGTGVVQGAQEDLMAAAWDQVGEVLEANRRIRRLQVAQYVSMVWHKNHLQPIATISASRALTLTAPLHARVIAGAVTLRHAVSGSKVTPVLLSPTMRRMIRPRAPQCRALPYSGMGRPDKLIDRVNADEVQPAPPKRTPAAVTTVAELSRVLLPAGGPLIDWLRRAPSLVYAPLALMALLALLLGASPLAALALVTIGVAGTAWLRRTSAQIQRADSLLEENQTPESVAALPVSPDFKLTSPNTGPDATVILTRGGADSHEGANFRAALVDLNGVLQASVRADVVGENGPARAALDIPGAVRATMAAVDPVLTIPRRGRELVRLPERLRVERPAPLTEVMAYPVFDQPMYRPLVDLSSELFLPNIKFIQQNTITLLETNQKFVEAYMIGLNHEMARELLWREYPTDQRGSCFRQFWDVSSFFTSGDDEELRERLRDIPPVDRWALDSGLGDHDARERPGSKRDEVVLAIRGELLKRYPNTVIYAQAADWARLPNGDIDRATERHLVDVTAAEADAPPREKLRTPLYVAKVEPDITFLGFDLTAKEALGRDGANRDDPAGWFFVIKERPGEPRFGFDVDSAAAVVVWNDLGWDQVPMSGPFIRPVGGAVAAIPGAVPPGEEEKEPQRKDDVQVSWNAGVSAAELAYIMYQAPVLVAVHAAEMLPQRMTE
jgi:hypothetical protein